MKKADLATSDIWGKFPPGLADAIQASTRHAHITPLGESYVRAALAHPSRRVASSVGNVCGRFASRKMGLTIEFESRTIELSRIIDNEANPEVIAFVSQPPQLKFKYRCSQSGRNLGYLRTPDLLEICGDHIIIVECKTEAELRKISIDRPDLISRNQNGRWQCPPGEIAAQALGMQFKVISEVDIPPARIRNLNLLLDYFHSDHNHLRTAPNQMICELLQDSPRISIESVLHELQHKVTTDDIYRAIATGYIVCDLDGEALIEHDRAFVFRDQATFEAYTATTRAICTAKPWMRATVAMLENGCRLNWDGRFWRLLNLGQTEVNLVNDAKVQSLPRLAFDQLHKEGHIAVCDAEIVESTSKASLSYQLLQAASPADLSRALTAYTTIRPHIEGKMLEKADRTTRRKLCNWRAAEASLGNGFVGLLPSYSKCGNRTPRLSEEVLCIVRQLVSVHYANPKKMRRIRVYERILDQCREVSLAAPSYGWFCSFLKRMPAYGLLKAREGRRAAYKLEERHISDGSVTSPHADRPFETAFIDHTQIDLDTLCSSTSKALGRPWLTTLIDDNSADVLAWYLTYDPPSYRSVLMTLRDCVRRHGRLLQNLVVDGGKEFQSTWFETTLAYFHVNIIRRPAARPRFGSRGERSFGTTNSNFLHTLLGNTQLRKNVRQLTPEVEPSNLAVWTFSALLDAFELYFDNYRDLEHRELLMTPREALKRGLEKSGDRPERRIVYDRDFLISTCPTSKKGSAKVQADGLKINYLYYKSPELHTFLGKSVPIRFEPFDMSIAYTFINGHWVTLTSRFQSELKGRTERELMVAREEYKRRRGQVEMGRLTDTRFVDFLKQMDSMEEMLLEHHRSIEEKRAHGLYISVGNPVDQNILVDLPLHPVVVPQASNVSVELDNEILECEIE